MGIESINSSTRATDKGTKIVKPGQEMDKNAFLRILTAELSNQDPQNTKDSTEYVAQMAQFASLEQMSNLNSNVTFSGATSLIGKGVQLDKLDDQGNAIVGIVKAVHKDSTGIKVSLDVVKNGKVSTEDYPYENVVGVVEINNQTPAASV